ncbi:MAG TPA: hypothetical protein VLG92_05640 [Candidatus Saccharimonadia bacterium]|nr:hypothetical protein [Candidatus Saccharimonadia bacterium]
MSRTQRRGAPSYHDVREEPHWGRKDHLKGFQGMPVIGSDHKAWEDIASASEDYKTAWDRQVGKLIGALISQGSDGEPELTLVAARGLWEMGQEKGDDTAIKIGLTALWLMGDEQYAIGDHLEASDLYDYSSC